MSAIPPSAEVRGEDFRRAFARVEAVMQSTSTVFRDWAAGLAPVAADPRFLALDRLQAIIDDRPWSERS